MIIILIGNCGLSLFAGSIIALMKPTIRIANTRGAIAVGSGRL
jgi:hypothetical protein